jgi:hypothetical protein
MFQHVKFPFPDERFPDELGAVIQKTVLDGQLPARYVAHTEDNGWVVGDDINDPNVAGAAIAAHIRHVVDADPTLEPLAKLPPGYQARRKSPNDPWEIQPFTYLADDEPFVPVDDHP